MVSSLTFTAKDKFEKKSKAKGIESNVLIEITKLISRTERIILNSLEAKYFSSFNHLYTYAFAHFFISGTIE